MYGAKPFLMSNRSSSYCKLLDLSITMYFLLCAAVSYASHLIDIFYPDPLNMQMQIMIPTKKHVAWQHFF